jgi:hypothetical protein
MAAVLNRTTKVYLSSANTPDYPESDWIRNPDMSAVTGWPSKYWIITGDVVSLMDAQQRALVDEAEAAATRDLVVTQIDNIEDLLRAVVLMTLDELNGHALKINAILDAVDAATSLSDLKTRVGTITDYPQRTPQQARTVIRSKLGI